MLSNTEEQKEYNRLIQQRHRQKENAIKELYQDNNVTGISFTEFKKQLELTLWQKLSIHLSDGELKIDKISFKLSDEQLRMIFNKAKELV